MKLKFKRALLKLSGEALKGKDEIYDGAALANVADQLIELANNGMQLGIVIGGGNIWRGNLAESIGMPQINGDYMGMMATVMNALALEAVLNQKGYTKTIVYSALEVRTVTEEYSFKKARQKLEDGYIVLFAGGTGYAYFTTDTAATVRAIEIDADVMLMAKNGVAGVYDKDPKTHPDAVFYEELTYKDITDNDLKVMDLTAATLASNADLKLEVFDMQGKDNIVKVAQGNLISTKIKR